MFGRGRNLILSCNSYIRRIYFGYMWLLYLFNIHWGKIFTALNIEEFNVCLTNSSWNFLLIGYFSKHCLWRAIFSLLIFSRSCVSTHILTFFKAYFLVCGYAQILQIRNYTLSGSMFCHSSCLNWRSCLEYVGSWRIWILI